MAATAAQGAGLLRLDFRSVHEAAPQLPAHGLRWGTNFRGQCAMETTHFLAEGTKNSLRRMGTVIPLEAGQPAKVRVGFLAPVCLVWENAQGTRALAASLLAWTSRCGRWGPLTPATDMVCAPHCQPRPSKHSACPGKPGCGPRQRTGYTLPTAVTSLHIRNSKVRDKCDVMGPGCTIRQLGRPGLPMHLIQSE